MHFPKLVGFPAGLECSWLLPEQQHTWGEVESHISITSSSSRTPSSTQAQIQQPIPNPSVCGVSHFSQTQGSAQLWYCQETLALPLTLCLESAGSGFLPWMNSSVKPVELQCWESLGKAEMGCSCWKTPSPIKCHEHHNSQSQNAALTLSPQSSTTGSPQAWHRLLQAQNKHLQFQHQHLQAHYK